MDPATRFRPTTLEFDIHDRTNLEHLSQLIDASAEFKKLSPDLPASTIADTVLACRGIEVLGFAGSTADLSRQFLSSRLPERALEVFAGFLPDADEKVEVLLPKEVVAREITDRLATQMPGSSGTQKLLEYDRLGGGGKGKFFLAEMDFGIQPSAQYGVEYARFSAAWRPAQCKDGRHLRTYAIAPDTDWQKYGNRTWKLAVTGDLGLGLPEAAVPGVSAGLKAGVSYVYETQLTLTQAVVTATNNGNDEMSWAMKRNPETGEDPRGSFRMFATLGIPDGFGQTLEELRSRVRVRLGGKVKRSTGWSFTEPRRTQEAVTARIRFITG
jgi:hypothetical protein